jgi:CRISPR-associated protein Cmr6
MTAIPMRRQAIDLLDEPIQFSHAGLWLSRGLSCMESEQGKEKQNHIRQATEIPVPEIYIKAFNRWQAIVTSADTIAYWCGKLESRLFIGTGGASVLETAITLSRTYGVPVIPGSAVKGLVHAYAMAARKAKLENALSHEQCLALFGHGGDDGAESGAVIFHDAWWVPDSAKTPLVAEIVTVHHQEYYGGKQDKATDFDSPIPAPQIAARGSFLFAVECGEKAGADYACKLLEDALQAWGIGGKTAAGYGRFGYDKNYQQQLEKRQKEAAEQALEAGKEAEKRLAEAAEQAIEAGKEAEKRRAEAAEQARLAGMPPLEREMEEIAKASPGEPKYLAVLKALERKKWEEGTARQVAGLVKQWMQAEKIWRDKSEKKKPEKDEPYQRTLRIKKFLGEG